MLDLCVFTGGGSGIGQSIALHFAQKGVPLLLVGRHASIERTKAMAVAVGGKVQLMVCDLEDFRNNFAILAAHPAVLKARRIGVVLAGSTLDTNSSAPADRLAGYERTFRTNVIGNLAVVEACLPRMVATGFGRTVFFAGGGAAYAYPLFPGYALSKVSTVRLTENLAAVYPPSTGLSFICLAPGAVETPMLEKVVAAGGEVRTKTSIHEPVDFVDAFLTTQAPVLSGRYLHVRDDWKAYFQADGSNVQGERFFLRRVP